MIKKKILNPDRIRCIQGGFSFIPHRFLCDGFFASLIPHELLLYFLLVLAGDRNGVSFYSYDKICTLLQMALDQYYVTCQMLTLRNNIQPSFVLPTHFIQITDHVSRYWLGGTTGAEIE